MIQVCGVKQPVRLWSPVLLAIAVLLGALSAQGSAEETGVPVRTLKEAGMSDAPVVPQLADIGAIAQAETTPPAESPPAVEFQRIPTQLNGSFTGDSGVGFEDSFFGLDGFVPLTQTPGKDLTYLQGRFLISTEGDPGGNVLLGYRHFSPANNAILGGYIGYDVRDTGKVTFNQVGAGVEGIWNSFEARANGYLPVGDTRQTTDRADFFNTSTASTVNGFSGLRFQGNNLLLDVNRTLTTTINQSTFRREQVALSGFDAEAGVKIAQWNPDGDLRSYLGLYYYSGSDVGGFVGVRGRLVARINQYASIGASIQGDPEFGTTGAVTVALQLPGMSRTRTSESTANWARMGDSVSRSPVIAVTERTSTTNTTSTTSATSTTTEAALNPATGRPYIFEHVVLGNAGGNGTFESPVGTVANALAIVPTDGNGIVYVQPGTNPGIPAFTIPNNVQVLSTGPIQTLPTVQFGVVQLPLSGAGTLPSVTNTVTMGNNTVLSGFAIVPPTGNPGILANGVQNVTIRDNRVQATGNNAAGISLQNVTGTATISKNAVSTNGNTTINPGGAHGITAYASTATLSNLVVTENTLATTGSDNLGLFLFAENTGRIASATISSNNITTTSTNAGGGIAIQTNQGGQIGTVNLTSNTVSTTGDGARGLIVDAQNGSAIATVNATSTTIRTTGNTAQGLFVRTNGNSTINELTLANSSITTQGTDADGAFINPITGSMATVTLSGNTISTSGATAQGINVSAVSTGQVGNITIANNRVTTQSPTAGQGIFLDSSTSATSAIATSTISGNTVSTTGTTLGIEAFFDQPTVPFQTTITNNTVQAGGSGILLASRESNGTATISGNTVNAASTSGIEASTAGTAGTVRVVIDNNTISNVSLAGGRQLGIGVSSNNNTQLFASVTNNRVTNANAFVANNQVEYRFFTTGTSNLCSRVLNNFASNSGYFFDQAGASTNRREPLTGNTGTVQPDAGAITNVAAGTCGF